MTPMTHSLVFLRVSGLTSTVSPLHRARRIGFGSDGTDRPTSRARGPPRKGAHRARSRHLYRAMRVTVSIDIMPRHIQLAAVILAGISILVLFDTLPILRTPQDALPLVIGPLVGPATEFAQFIAIGPENRVPQRHRGYGIAAYVAFVAVCNTVVARYYSSPNVKAAVQGLCSALRGEAPVPDFMSLDAQDMDELLALVLTAFMSASLSVFTLALGLDLAGPWSGLRTYHFTTAIAFLIMPARSRPSAKVKTLK